MWKIGGVEGFVLQHGRSNLRAAAHALDGACCKLDAPPKRLPGVDAGEPGGQKSGAEGVTRPRCVGHARWRGGDARVFATRVGVEGSVGAELQDDGMVVGEQGLCDAPGVFGPCEEGALLEVGQAQVGAAGPFEEVLRPYVLEHRYR